jgi:hypothetical protein
MSSLRELQSKLNDTGAALATLDRAIATDPRSPALEFNRRALEKRLLQLEDQFLIAATRAGIDVCSYRLVSKTERFRVASLAGIFVEFQTFISVLFDALKNGPKKNASVSGEIAEKTAFEFGYAFSGSVGFVLTIANEQLLIGETDLDDCVKTAFEMGRSLTPNDIRAFTTRIGVGPVRAMHRWATAHSTTGLGADIDWRHGATVRDELRADPADFEVLRQAIELSSDEVKESFAVVAELVGADVTNKRFHLKLESGEEIRGVFTDAIGPQHKVQIPRRYRAHLVKTSKTSFATDQEEVSYFLEKIESL